MIELVDEDAPHRGSKKKMKKAKISQRSSDILQLGGSSSSDAPLLLIEDTPVADASTAPLLEDTETTTQHAKRTGAWITWRDVKDWWFAEGPKAVIYLLWVLVQVILGTNAAIVYWNKPNYYVTVARICGAMLNLNCALILVCVLRNLLTWARKTVLSRIIPFDKNITFHRHIAWAIAVQGFFHGFAHFLNYNEAENPWSLAWGTLAGSTGHIITLCMLVMYTTSWESVRRRYFNAFFFAHHLFIVFFICLLMHGPRFWYYFLGPGVLYTIERVIREFRGRKMTTTVVAVKSHPSNVIEVRMHRNRFKYKPGQYLFLNCPTISRFEWHPFTISSAPEEEFVSVHIRCCGDWTKALRDLVTTDAKSKRQTLLLNQDVTAEGKALLRLDGPFGAASEEVFHYKVAVLIGAGIGVTPFASVLKSIKYRLEMGRGTGQLEKVYFFWSSRDQAAFEWFQALLAGLEQDLAAAGMSSFLEINIYLTGAMKIDEVRELMHQDLASADPITQLHAKTNFGRPRFPDIFKSLRLSHRNTTLGVFFCGPRPLATVLDTLCKEYSKEYDVYGTRFAWNKENF